MMHTIFISTDETNLHQYTEV